MDFLDVSLAFPVRWHDIIDILEMNNPPREAERERGGGWLCPGQEIPSRHHQPPTNPLCTEPWPGALCLPRKQREPCEYKDIPPTYTCTHIYQIKLIQRRFTRKMFNKCNQKSICWQKNTFYTTLNGRRKSSTGSGAGRAAGCRKKSRNSNKAPVTEELWLKFHAA